MEMKNIYADALDKNKADVYNEQNRSLLNHNKLETSEGKEMYTNHDYEEVDVTKGRCEIRQQNGSLSRLKCFTCILAVLVVVIFATIISFAVFFYLQKAPDMMSTFSVNTPFSYSTFNGTSRLTFANTIYQYGDDFNMSSGTFICSIPGIYHFSVTIVKKGPIKSNSTIHCKIHKSSFKDKNVSVIRIADTGCTSSSQAFVINLDIRDQVYLGTCHDDDIILHLEWWSSFTGFLLYPVDN